MLAIYLSPFYIIINLYLLRWFLLWIGSCADFMQYPAVRIFFILIDIFIFTTPLTSFLIKKPSALHHALKVISNYFLGILLYMLMIIPCADLIRIIFKYVLHFSWTDDPAAFILSGSICFILITGLSISGIFHAKHLIVNPYDITINKNNPRGENLKIILIADTHFGYNSGVIQARKLVKKINQQHPDLVCIAGDIFDNEFDAIREPSKLSSTLKRIDSKYGVYACWGNHDLNEPILAGFTFKNKNNEVYADPRMSQFLKESNVKLLEDSNILINDSFYLIGRNDADLAEKSGKPRRMPSELTKDLNHEKPIIMIDHQPKELQQIADAGIDLDLCGHTHNGQIFPGNYTIKPVWENPCGLLKKDKMINIVTSGAGIWGPAMRLGTNSEICVIQVHFLNTKKTF